MSEGAALGTESAVAPTGFGPVWGVAGLLLAVADALSARLGAVTVRGELGAVTRAASGHLYFNLKDGDGASAALRCAMFRRSTGMLSFVPSEGHLVELRGRVAVYEPRGELQLIVESMQPLGEGGLYEEFLRRRKRLAALGLFDQERKRPLVVRPKAVGVITSLSGAALHDVCTAFARRAPQVRVWVYPSLVQGAEAPAAIVRALASAQSHGQAETLLVVRGGGSLEDLWAFNDERVAQAVAASSIPVISGVGHETDVTLCDLAADLRAATPTAAAELAATPLSDDTSKLLAQAQALHSAMSRRVERGALRLDRCSEQLSRPASSLALWSERLLRREAELQSASRAALARQGHRLDQFGGALKELDPRAVLRRGFAWLSDEQGQGIGSVSQLPAGAAFNALLADGQVRAKVLP